MALASDSRRFLSIHKNNIETMNKREEKKFIELVNQDETSKVKIDNTQGYWGTFEDGTSEEFTIYEITFDGEAINDEMPHELLTAIHGYFHWSSNRIKELEAKLALARISSD